jgi:hypothetical protein
MNSLTRFAIASIACLATPAGLRAQQLQPQTVHDHQLVRGQEVQVAHADPAAAVACKSETEQ